MSTAAQRYNTSLEEYRGWENDTLEGAKRPKTALGQLTRHDIFLLLRRRSGKTVKEIAKEVKCCQWWLRQMEKGDAPDERLSKYWGLKN